MNDNEWQHLLGDAKHFPVNEKAKQQAIGRALEVFVQEFSAAGSASEENKNSTESQENTSPLRPTENPKLGRSSVMQKTWQRYVYSGLAAASVLVTAGILVLQFPSPDEIPEAIAVEESDLTKNRLMDGEAQQVNSSPRHAALTPVKPLGEITARAQKPEPNLRELPEQKIAASAVKKRKDEAAYRSVQTDASAEALTSLSAINAEDIAVSPPSRSAEASAGMTLPATPSQEHFSRSVKPLTEPHVVERARENRDSFPDAGTQRVKRVMEEPVSTFSIDVDTASYTFARRQLNRGMRPPAESIRVEEFINYFDYDYPAPEDVKQPFATHVLVGEAPWRPGNKLLHIGIQGMIPKQLPRSNLVFLLDVSGSMNEADKLPLVKQSMQLLLDQLDDHDSVAIVVYAGAAGTVLPPTSAKEKSTILAALNQLQAGGSTAGAQGIELAYTLAEQHFSADAVNRIFLATDGDFNVGIADPEKLKAYVAKKREKGIYLSVLGFGQGNYQDSIMQALAQNGNGVAAYIDTLSEAQKVLVHEARSALFPIANDVKIQIEFNPATVAEYRLLGYETRALKQEDFNNDRVDAGDIGAGHSVTALYEITPHDSPHRLMDDSRYAEKSKVDGNKNEYAQIKLRYKLPGTAQSQLLTQIVSANDSPELTQGASNWQQREFAFASAVAGFAQLLKNDEAMGEWTYDAVIELALKNRGEDVFGYRNEFVQLVRKAKITQ